MKLPEEDNAMRATDGEWAKWARNHEIMTQKWAEDHPIKTHRPPKRYIPWGLLSLVICMAILVAGIVIAIWTANPPRLRY